MRRTTIRRRGPVGVGLLAAWLLVSACNITIDLDGAVDDEREIAAASTTSTQADTSTTVAGAGQEATSSTDANRVAPGCEEPTTGFVESGAIGRIGESRADAVQIAGIALVTTGECERIEIELTTAGGAPATTLPVVGAEALAGTGIVRLRFDRAVQSSAVAESLIEAQLVDRIFVVRGLDSRIFVDIVIGDSAAARISEVHNPARVVIELQPGILPVTAGPVITDDLVITAPVHQNVEYPLVVEGYVRADPGLVTGRVSRGDEIIAETQTSASITPGTWGEFRIEVEDGPAGNLDLAIDRGTEIAERPLVQLRINAG